MEDIASPETVSKVIREIQNVFDENGIKTEEALSIMLIGCVALSGGTGQDIYKLIDIVKEEIDLQDKN